MQNLFITTTVSALLLAGTASSQINAKLYVTNNWTNSGVSVIDPATNILLRTIATGDYPTGIVYATDTNQVYVAQNFGVAVIDVITDAVTSQVSIPGGAYRLLLSNDKSTLFIAGASGIVTAMDRATLTLKQTAQPNPSAFLLGLACSQDGSKLFASSGGGGASTSQGLWVFDSSTLTLLAQISLPQDPRGVTLSPDGSQVWVASESGYVTVVDPNTYAIIATIPTPLDANEIAFNAAGTTAYVTANTVFAVINPVTYSVTSVNRLDGTAWGRFRVQAQSIVLGPDQQAYFPVTFDQSPSTSGVAVVNLTSNNVTMMIPTPFGAWSGAFSGQTPSISLYLSGPIHPQKSGAVTVAVLGSAAFNPLATLDVSSLKFGATGNERSLVSCGIGGEDVNRDGYSDLVCHFDVQLTNLQLGATQAYLRGQTVSHNEFVGTVSVTVN